MQTVEFFRRVLWEIFFFVSQQNSKKDAIEFFEGEKIDISLIWIIRTKNNLSYNQRCKFEVGKLNLQNARLVWLTINHNRDPN